jgi:predicted N-acetyltransferase YhbS
MKLTYSTLHADGVREAAVQTHKFWGGKRTLEQHTQRAFDALGMLGENLRYVGLRDEDGALVASLQFYTVALQTPNGVARTLGIGAVFVPESQRGNGYGQGVVRAAMEEAKSLGYDAALLYSDIAPQFYTRLGYVEFPAFDWSTDVSALPNDAPLTTRPAIADNFNSISVWYHADAAWAEIFPVRSPETWEFLRWLNGAAGDLILCDDTREVGYINVRSTPQGLRHYEWVAPAIEPARVWATIRKLTELEGQSQVYGWLRPDRREEWMSVTPRPAAIPMIAPLNDSLTVTAEMRAVFREMDHF